MYIDVKVIGADESGNAIAVLRDTDNNIGHKKTSYMYRDDEHNTYNILNTNDDGSLVLDLLNWGGLPHWFYELHKIMLLGFVHEREYRLVTLSGDVTVITQKEKPYTFSIVRDYIKNQTFGYDYVNGAQVYYINPQKHCELKDLSKTQVATITHLAKLANGKITKGTIIFDDYESSTASLKALQRRCIIGIGKSRQIMFMESFERLAQQIDDVKTIIAQAQKVRDFVPEIKQGCKFYKLDESIYGNNAMLSGGLSIISALGYYPLYACGGIVAKFADAIEWFGVDDHGYPIYKFRWVGEYYHAEASVLFNDESGEFAVNSFVSSTLTEAQRYNNKLPDVKQLAHLCLWLNRHAIEFNRL